MGQRAANHKTLVKAAKVRGRKGKMKTRRRKRLAAYLQGRRGIKIACVHAWEVGGARRGRKGKIPQKQNLVGKGARANLGTKHPNSC